MIDSGTTGGSTPATATLLALVVASALACAAEAPIRVAADGYAVEEKSLVELQLDMSAGRVSAEALVDVYLSRIRSVDHAGPTLRSVLSVNPAAAAEARRLDEERAQGKIRGPLHGIPILLKDNIESADPLATTAGSLALQENRTGRDAPIVARLRAAGAVILGKTNLSEWANIRSSRSSSGWSAVGGLTLNPYALDRSACGSSSGSGVAVAANLAALAVGTETDGSITCPASVNGIVGLKPTVGLLSRRHIVPISHTQDTAGPMARTVADAAALLAVMAGSDTEDPATAQADQRRQDYAAALSFDALRGKRLGVMRFSMGYLPAVDALFEQAVQHLQTAGAEVVDLQRFDNLQAIEQAELPILLTELKANLNAYLATTPPAVPTRTLADVIAFNQREAERELVFFGQNLFVQAEASPGLSDASYRKARSDNLRLAGREGIDRLLAEYSLDALIAPTMGPAWTIDLINGDHIVGGATTLAAVAGYPHLTVPMGHIRGLPVGLSFVGPAWSEALLLAMGHAFEARASARRPPTFAPTVGP